MCQRLCRQRGNNRSNNGAGSTVGTTSIPTRFLPSSAGLPNKKRWKKNIYIYNFLFKLHGLLPFKTGWMPVTKQHRLAAATDISPNMRQTHICGRVRRDNDVHHSSDSIPPIYSHYFKLPSWPKPRNLSHSQSPHSRYCHFACFSTVKRNKAGIARSRPSPRRSKERDRR